MPAAYRVDSRKAFCKMCDIAIIAKHCELERHDWLQKHADKPKVPLANPK